MTRTLKISTALVALLFAVPVFAYADQATARLGGGNAGLRGGVGVGHANPTSNIVSRVSFAGTQGGQPESVPQTNANQNAQGNSTNGGTNSGNGGSGGNSAPGGSVNAGGAVSNSTAVNAINTTIIRISIR